MRVQYSEGADSTGNEEQTLVFPPYRHSNQDSNGSICLRSFVLLFIAILSIMMGYLLGSMKHPFTPQWIPAPLSPTRNSPTSSPTKEVAYSPPKYIMDALQTIESSIYFDRINIDDSNSSQFSTGISPHFLDGPVLEGKRCPFIKYRYLCNQNVATDMGLDQWSLMLHPLQFDPDEPAKRLLSVIQRELNYYRDNIFEHHFRRNLEIHQSVL